MIRWFSGVGGLEGFLFWPFWEVAVGWLLMIVALVVPLLFVIFNGFNPKQYLEWLFCLGFLVFFLWMGSVLAFQSFTARILDGRLVIDHNLRDPPLHVDIPTPEWLSSTIRSNVNVDGKLFTVLFVQTVGGECEIFRTVNFHIADYLVRALETLRLNKP
ncbi:MAG: hypothetical protein HQM08_14200 [Candidatus Riflebacteria bacterium]|nr:hypothetical protein [Candidatus Riflebacteria bacterium]